MMRPPHVLRALQLAIGTSLVCLSSCAVSGCGPAVSVDGDSGTGGGGGSTGTQHTGGGNPSSGGAGGGGAGGGGAGGASTSGGGMGGTTSFPVPEGCNLTFDPMKVYMFATLQEGAAYREAVALPEDPLSFCVGFEEASPPVIRPTDKALLYLGSPKYADGDDIRVFTPDALEWDSAAQSWQYPADAASDDPVIPSPKCAAPGVLTFTVNPENGEVVYRCWSNALTYTEGGTPVAIPEFGHLFDYGYGDHKLAISSYDLVLLDPQGTEIPIPAIPWPDFEYVTARARADGFWVVTRDDDNVLARWHVDFTGAAVNEGSYAPPPPMLAVHAEGKLDGDGNLVAMADHTDVVFQDAIVRLPLSPAAGEVIYDEGNGPPGDPDWGSEGSPGFYPKLHISYLFTGP